MRTFTIVQCEQQTPQWYQARAGRATGSHAHDVMAQVKSGEAAGRRDYKLRLAVERLTGRPEPEDFFGNEHTERGNELEPEARMEYEARSGNPVLEVGFCAHTTDLTGCSPDGVVDDFVGLTSFKCPKAFHQVQYIRAGKLPMKYRWQAAHEMLITGAQWYDFVSWCPALTSVGLDYFCVRSTREELEIKRYQDELRRFLGEVTEEVEELRKLGRLAA